MNASSPLDGAVFDHVAHAAPSLLQLLPLYRDMLGGRFYHGGDNRRAGYRALQLAYADDTRVELMEPLEGSRFFERFFARNPGGGLHHVTFRVPSLDVAIAAARRGGFELTGENRSLPEHMEVFLHPRSAHGTLVQLVQGPSTPAPPGLTIERVLAGA
jgi:methylmalonyl-CoA/ethylmalonyl-CoA epimerase